MKRIVIIFWAIILSACATTKQYAPVSDLSNLSPGNVLIKVERRSDFMGSGRSIEVSDDGTIVGQVAPGEFLVWQRPAGIFVLQLVPKTGVISNPVPLKIDAKSGQQYDFEIFWRNWKGFELQRRIP
jgi:hypothetical protein